MAEGGVPPRVSVLIAAWKAEATLSRAIDTALDQTVSTEVIVVDDASPDGTAGIAAVRAAADPRVVAMVQPVNLGPAAARNCALSQARAPWVTVLDADDFFCARDRLERLLEIAGDERADFVADDLWKVAADAPDGPRTALISGDPIGRVTLDAAAFVAGNLASERDGRRELGFLKPLMSVDFLDRHGIRYDEEIRLGEDYVLYTRALIAGARFIITDAAGYVACVRADSLAAKHPTEAHAHLVAADRMLLSLPQTDEATRRALGAHLLEHRRKLAWRRLLDAKKIEGPLGIAACFWLPPVVLTDLLGRIWEEATARIGRRLRQR